MINQDILKGNWKEIKGAIRKKWGELTDNELDQAQGNIEQIRGMIQKKYGQKKEDAQVELDRLLNQFDRLNNVDKERH